jgi:hypothetical protein
MPTLEEAVNSDLSNYSHVVPQPKVNAPTPSGDLQPGRSSMMRCPLPILGQATPDSLRSYFLKGQVPQTRVLSPQAVVQGNGSSATTSTSVSSSSSSTVAVVLNSVQATVTTATIGPNQVFTGILNMAKSFQLLSIAATSLARIELYGTPSAQSGDLSRGLDASPAAGTAQNIICDIALDTTPMQWSFQSRMGANADNPQSTKVYVSVTNLGSTSAAITVTLVYLPLET